MDEQNQTKTPQNASLPLQMLLYYNSMFSIFYWILMAMIISTKLQYQLDDAGVEVYIIACFILYTIGDLMRLPFALWGNQTEQVPALAAAMLMSVFPTMPALVYLTFAQPKLFPFEFIAGLVQFGFLLFEFPLLWKALRKNADVQQARFIRLTIDNDEFKNNWHIGCGVIHVFWFGGKQLKEVQWKDKQKKAR